MFTTVPDCAILPKRKPLTIIGLGNEMLSDDGAGIRIVRELKQMFPADDVDIHELSVGGLQLLDYINGCEQCIIVDAVVTGTHPAGTAFRFTQTSDSKPVTLSSSHQIDLAQVLTLATLLGADIPRSVVVYGIEAHDLSTFHEGCTKEVARAIPKLVEVVYRDVKSGETVKRPPAGSWQVINDPD